MSDKKVKLKKVKGPIRTGAVVPFFAMVILVTVFNIFFLDSTVKKIIEVSATSANGAEVNVGGVDISIINLKTTITNIQFTNKENPNFNTFEIGRIQFQALWDAILRAKLVINLAEVKDIKIETKRKYPGKIEPIKVETSEDSKLAKEVLANTEKEFEGNVLGDISALLSGNKVGGEAGIEGTLKSKQKYEELSSEISVRSERMDRSFSELPDSKELDALNSRFNKIDWKGLGTITKAPKILKDIDTLKKDIDKTKNKYEEANKQLNSNIKFINDGQKEVQALVKEDIQDLQKRMKIPSLDAKSIAKILFGSEILDKLKEVERYKEEYKEYLPQKKKDAAKPEFTKTPRGSGRNYKFGKPNSYPSVWIKKVAINSLNDQGSVEGEILNITTDQNLINKATMLKIKANFKKEGIENLVAVGVFDHRNGADDKLNISVGKYPVLNKALSQSAAAKLIIAKARGNADFKVHYKDEQISFIVENFYKDIEYEHGADSKALAEVLEEVARTTKVISMEAKATGKIKNLDWKIQSNLGKAIQDSVSNLVQAKITAAKKKIQDDIDRQIGGEKKKIDAELTKFKSKYQGQIDQGQKQFDDLKGKIDKEKSKNENNAKKSIEDKAKNLLKKIKF